jgi:hypothetical protein
MNLQKSYYTCRKWRGKGNKRKEKGAVATEQTTYRDKGGRGIQTDPQGIPTYHTTTLQTTLYYLLPIL